MTRVSASPVLNCLAGEGASHLVTGAAVFDVMTFAAAGAPAPEWVKLAPRGRFKARDGREFEVNPEQLVARFQADGIDVAVDLDHATAKKALFGETAPAVGWIKELAAKPDGLHGRIDWLEAGLATLAARTHRYISPTFPTDPKGIATWLHSAALVATPGLAMAAIVSADPHNPTKDAPMLKKIAAALGLADTSDETACLNAISTLSTRVDKAVHDRTLATLSATTSELEGLKKAGHEKEVADMFEAALTAKKITPAQRTELEPLCASVDGLAQVKKLIAATAGGLAASGLDDRKAGDLNTLSAAQAAAAKALGIPAADYLKTLQAEAAAV